MNCYLQCSILLTAVLIGAAKADEPVTAANVLSATPARKLLIKPGTTAELPLAVKLVPNYHVNSNAPSNPYLIGLKLTWSTNVADTAEVSYPKPELAKLAFSDTPVSVFSGEFDVVTKFHLPANTPPGPAAVSGKLRYQACNDRLCLPPKTIDITLPVEVTK
ncbi:MAG: protein-disulfide reductase DsbD domain-containing protein [Bryobacteraceae bacterium]